MAAISRDELLSGGFLEAVQRLRLTAGRVPRGGRFAEHRSHDLGHGLEFRDFRAYAPGDDVRSIDWNIYRRSGKVFLRLFEEFEDLPLYLLPDVSRSQYLETPPRALAGLRCALALGSISLGQHDQVRVFPFADDLRVDGRVISGSRRTLALAGVLGGIEPGGETDFRSSLRRLHALGLRRGLVALVSDCFDPGGVEAIIESLRSLRHGVLLVQLVRATDADPSLQGDVRLRDCESSEVADVSLTDEVLRRYREAYQAFDQQLSAYTTKRGIAHLKLDVDGDVAAQLAALLEARGAVA